MTTANSNSDSDNLSLAALQLLIKGDEKVFNELLTKNMREVAISVADIILKEKFDLKLVRMCLDINRQLLKTPEFRTLLLKTPEFQSVRLTQQQEHTFINQGGSAVPVHQIARDLDRSHCTNRQKTTRKRKREGERKTEAKTDRKQKENTNTDTDTDGEDLNETVDDDERELQGQTNDDNYRADPDATEDDLAFIDDGDVESENGEDAGQQSIQDAHDDLFANLPKDL